MGTLLATRGLPHMCHTLHQESVPCPCAHVMHPSDDAKAGICAQASQYTTSMHTAMPLFK